MSRRGGGTPRHPTAKHKGGWSPEEDATLVSLVKRLGEGQWSPIARELNEIMKKTESTGRIGKQCRERWNHHLSPGLRKDPWTSDEERKLVEAHRLLKNHWSGIARCIPGRSENAVKNHWHATLRKRVTPENPAGPLKAYLDTLDLTVAPRRRGIGGASARSGGGGSKRRRSCREPESSSSSTDSDEASDGDADYAEQEGHNPDSTGPGPSRGVARIPKSIAAAAARRPHSKIAGSAGGKGAGGFDPFDAVAAVRFGHSAMKSEPLFLGPPGPSGAQKRFPSDKGALVNQEGTRESAVAAAYGSIAATRGEIEPERAAAMGSGVRRRRSKRAAAQVGNERLRNLVEAEQREAAAEAAEDAEAAAAAAGGSVVQGDGTDSRRVAPGSYPETQSFETEAAAGTGAIARAGAGGLEALPVVKLEASLRTQPSRTESSCDSGPSFSDNALRAIAADVAEATDGAGTSTAANYGAAAAATAVAAAAAVAVGMDGVDGPGGDLSPDPAPFPLGGAGTGTSTQGQNGPKSELETTGLGAGTTVVQLAAAAEPKKLPHPDVATGAGTGVPPSGGKLSTLLIDHQDAAAVAAGTGGPGGGAAGWANGVYSGSTNDMQGLADGQQSRRSSYGISLGGKVRPRFCPRQEVHTPLHGLDTTGVANTVGDIGVGGTTTAARGGGTRSGAGASPGTSTPVPTLGTTASDGTPSVFLARTCGDDEDLLLDTPVDYSGTMCLRHVASGSALFDYDMRHGPELANGLATPPSPTKAAAATARRATAASAAAAPSVANPSLPWTARSRYLSFPECALTPSCLFDGIMDFVPDSPRNQPGENLLPVPEPEGRASGNLAAGGGDVTAAGSGNADGGMGKGQADTEMTPVNIVVPYGLIGGVGCAGSVNAVRANSSITSVGSPLSDVYVENGESGVRVGGTSGAMSLHAGTAAAAAASAAAITVAAGGAVPSGGGGLADHPEVLTKRESGINAPHQHGAVSTHPMAPFKIVVPPPLAGPATQLQPASPWTPAQGMSASAPPLSITHTMPAQPASPGHWAGQLPLGQASGASVHMQYGLSAGSAAALPAIPSLTSSSTLSPQLLPQALPAQSSHMTVTVTATATNITPQLQHCQQMPLPLNGLYDGASILQDEHGYVLQHPQHSAVMSQPFSLMPSPAPPTASAQPLGQPPQRQQSGMEPAQLQTFQAVRALQTQQPQQHALLRDYIMSPGCFYIPPGPLAPFGGIFNALPPCSPAPGYPPMASQMPVPMHIWNPCHYVPEMSTMEDQHQLHAMQGMTSLPQQQQQGRKQQLQQLSQWTSQQQQQLQMSMSQQQVIQRSASYQQLQPLQQSTSHQQLQMLPQSTSHQQLQMQEGT
ncbi:hypothetical protein Vafri_6959 [Volvox africanus]|uniref:Uncharacterized protein n=1 Tax=Volvox africanus TaxID=51714 RepID=A0A8J4B3U7_9CHLO|nr:hypothetical protein Vafri_6959 [Volvox africanus]